MGYCSIRNCRAAKTSNADTIRFYRIPKQESIAKEWLRYCRSTTNRRNGRVCSVHFTPDDSFKSLRHTLMNESPVKVRHIKPDAIPSLMLPTDNVSTHLCNAVIDDNARKLTICSIEVPVSSDQITSKKNYNFVDLNDNNKGSKTADNNIPERRKIHVIRNEVLKQKDGFSSPVKPAICRIRQPSIHGKKIEIPLSVYNLIKKKLSTHEVLLKNLKQIFTPGQIHSLLQPEMPRVKWSTEDIESAISLRNVGVKSYDHLRATGVPLPSVSTLYKWSAKYGVPLVEDIKWIITDISPTANE